MSSGDSESWARLRLVQGESSAQVWELVASAGQTTLTVGLSPGCHWVVREEGVAPVHFSLHWDGGTLRIADTYGAGDVRVDGQVVGPQWRALSGRMRIDFGKAAIVVEASAAPRSDAPHPLEPGQGRPPSSPAGASGPGAPGKGMKATLIGVSPLTGAPAAIAAAHAAPGPSGGVSVPTAAEAPSEPPSDSFRPKRPSDSARAPKPTLVGMAAVPGAPRPPGSAPAPAKPASSAPPGPAAGKGVTNATLMGFAADLPPAGGQRVGGASLGDADQRTIQGFPAAGSSQPPPATSGQAGRRVTQQGVVSEVPGVVPGAVTRAPVRTISSNPPGPAMSPSGRPLPPGPDPEGKVWHELPPGPSEPPGVPQAVLTGRVSSSAPPPAQQGSGLGGPRVGSSHPPPRGSSAPRPRERFSDAPPYQGGPAAPRDPATLDSRRPKGAFPWPYVGIALLTALAYFAWLYLLDHL